MGGGSWTSKAFTDSLSMRGMSAASVCNMNASQYFESRRLDPVLNPKNVVRECCDSEEHPNTIPVILALDVTGSMGHVCTECAAQLDKIMTKLYEEVSDVEFLVMGIGDLAYDDAPIQASQFESDIRIKEQLDKIYFEAGGGGNGYESYTAAWYFGLRNTKLDCWKRGKKGIIITMGDEPLNPYLPGSVLSDCLGCPAEDVDTRKLYKEVTEKFDVYHLGIGASFKYYADDIKKTWGKMLGERYRPCTVDQLSNVIVNIVKEAQYNSQLMVNVDNSENPNLITW